MDSNSPSDGASWTFILASLVVATLITGLCVFAASRQWFVADDFWFLAFAQWDKSWLQVFLPLRTRLWWTYRPLTTDVFFTLSFQLFDREPFGYLVLSLLIHFLTGVVVYRLARQFRFETRIALLTAVLSVSRYPSLTEGLWISVAQYTVTTFLYCVSLSLFIDYARSCSIRLFIASVLAFLLTLLSNESGATLAAVVVLTSLFLDESGSGTERLFRTLRRTSPYLIITVGYLLFRTMLIAPARLPAPALYTWTAGWHILENYFRSLVSVLGADRTWVLGGLAPLAAALVAVASSGEARAAIVKPLLRVAAVCVGWVVVGMLPFVGLPITNPRFAMSIEVPVCLLCGACLNAFSIVYSGRHRVAVECLLLGLLVLSLPYGAVWDRAMRPKGNTGKQLVSLIRDANPPNGTAVVVKYGSDGLGTVAESERFWAWVFGDAVLWAFYADKDFRLRLWDVSQPFPQDLQCPPCVFVDLKPGLGLAVAQRDPVAQAGVPDGAAGD